MLTLACATATSAPNPAPRPAPAARLLPEETHLAELRQLTFGGENAEAYWSFDGQQLSFQARGPTEACDRIWRLPLSSGTPVPVSSGKGATTCSHFLPGDQELIYASTQLAGDACPPRPDHSQGYVWALYDSYEIFRSNADGSGLRQLTNVKGYDAEGTVCAKDGSIVFTSTRDGDIELYRMDKDGGNVQRLTHTPGYDGGAFFNRDCTKLVWRASRPKPGKELEDYQRLLAKGLVRPSKLELFVANADGSDPVQLTYLDAASFAPYWHPSQDRILFSSNYGDPKGREFDLWSIRIDGTGLERITSAPGFDGFPMFSPDGQWLAFSSNRATAPGQHDTNVFVARWVESPPQKAANGPAERIMRDIAWLAAPERGGRGIGTPGLEAAGAYLEQRFGELGLAPAGERGYRHPFAVTTGITVGEGTEMKLGGSTVARDDLAVMGFSALGEAKGPLVLAGYGISDKALGVDDYAKVDAKGKIVLVRRFVPDGPPFNEVEKQRRFGDIRYKAWAAREHGAKALVVVDWPEPPANAPKDWSMPQEARLPALNPEGPTDAGIPVVPVKRSAVTALMPALAAKKRVEARIQVNLAFEKKDAFNVVGRITAGSPQKLPGVVLIGAHYDHLGMGGRYSLAPDKHEPHVGADDNASGTATLLEIARQLMARRGELRRDVLVVAFSGEESGVLGSTAFTRAPPNGLKLDDAVAMLNLDMVGRMRADRLSVLGADSAEEWAGVVQAACDRAHVECTASGDGYGPSDQTPFFGAGIPVLHFFTGPHSDYHKPSDTPALINAAGAAQIARIAADVAVQANAREVKLTYKKTRSPTPLGDMRTFNASLGTIPDYAGPPNGQRGVLLSGVRQGGAADKAGMRRGDILVRLGKHEIGSVEDLMYVLTAAKPGETVSAVVLRDGREVTLEATYQESKRH